MLAVHVSQAALPCDWSADASSSFADQVSSLSRLTELTLPIQGSVLGRAGTLDALRQLSMLQSLSCRGDDLQTLLVNSVSCSLSLLTRLQVIRPDSGSGYESLDWSLVEQQCPQLQALATIKAMPLCLTALTSLTCNYWLPQDTDSFQCSRLGHLHVRGLASLNLLPSTLTSLSLDSISRSAFMVYYLEDQRLRSQPPLVHICFTSQLVDLSQIRRLVSGIHPVLASVTSVKLTIQPQAFIPPDMDGVMTGRCFDQLGAWFPYLQRLHIHLQGRQQAEETLISAAWLLVHCRLVVTHKLSRTVCIVKCPSGCLSLPLSSCPELK